jgi:hypothetical protein
LNHAFDLYKDNAVSVSLDKNYSYFQTKQKVMENKVFQLESDVINYELGFEEDKVYCHLVRRMNECPVNQVQKVVIKKHSMGSGDEISFRIFYNENGKEKKFPWIQAKITSSVTQDFFAELQSRIPDVAVWEDRTLQETIDEDGNKVYDLQYLPLGYGGAGLSRTLQIWIYLICLGILVIPLIYYIYLLSTGGYRIYTNDQGLTVRKAGATLFKWDDIQNVEFTRVKVVDRDTYSKTQVLKAKFIGSNSKKSVVMRYDHALPLLKELAERNVISEDYLSDFVR